MRGRYCSLVELTLSALLTLAVTSFAALCIAEYAYSRDDGLGYFVLSQDWKQAILDVNQEWAVWNYIHCSL